MKRVMIVGQPGAGKSTLARAIGAAKGLPVIHVDQIHWMPGWQERPRAEKIAMARAAEARPEWVFEGGLSATWDTRLARADTLIILDFSYVLRMWRVIKRTLRDYGRNRDDLPPNCPERFDREFLRWIWDTRQTGKRRFPDLKAQAAGKVVHHFQRTRDVQSFLQDLTG